jgi:peptide chain release factor 3
MVLDAAKGIESQTLKLFQVCRSRNLPVITFNKYDRPGREPFELLDEIEKQIQLRPTPVTWPWATARAPGSSTAERCHRFTGRPAALRCSRGDHRSRPPVPLGSGVRQVEGRLDEDLLDAIAPTSICRRFSPASTPVFVGSR